MHILLSTCSSHSAFEVNSALQVSHVNVSTALRKGSLPCFYKYSYEEYVNTQCLIKGRKIVNLTLKCAASSSLSHLVTHNAITCFENFTEQWGSSTKQCFLLKMCFNFKININIYVIYCTRTDFTYSKMSFNRVLIKGLITALREWTCVSTTKHIIMQVHHRQNSECYIIDHSRKIYFLIVIMHRTIS